MATPFTDIYDLFLINIRDYKIDKIYAASTPLFYDYLEGFLLMAIPQFDNCKKDLEDYSNSILTATLTLREKTILANLMTIQWLNKEINDVTQFQNHLSTTDFMVHSEAQNLRGKVEHRDGLREIVNQDMLVYDLKNTNWDDWANGVFT